MHFWFNNGLESGAGWEPIEIECSNFYLPLFHHTNDIVHLDITILSKCPEANSIDLTVFEKLESLQIAPFFVGSKILPTKVGYYRKERKKERTIHTNAKKIIIDPIFKYIDPSWLEMGSRRAGRFGRLEKIEIEWLDYRIEIEKFGWNHFKHRILDTLSVVPKKWLFHAQRGLLEGFSLTEIAGIDCNPAEIIEAIPDDTKPEKLWELMEDTAIEFLDAHLDRGGFTTVLDIESMKTKKSAILISKILRNAEEEIKKIVIPIQNEIAYLRSFILTRYGRWIVSLLKLGDTCGLDDLDRIKSELNKLGLLVWTEEVDDEKIPYPRVKKVRISYPKEMSPSMRYFLFQQGRNVNISADRTRTTTELDPYEVRRGIREILERMLLTKTPPVEIASKSIAHLYLKEQFGLASGKAQKEKNRELFNRAYQYARVAIKHAAFPRYSQQNHFTVENGPTRYVFKAEQVDDGRRGLVVALRLIRSEKIR